MKAKKISVSSPKLISKNLNKMRMIMKMTNSKTVNELIYDPESFYASDFPVALSTLGIYVKRLLKNEYRYIQHTQTILSQYGVCKTREGEVNTARVY